MKKLALVSLLGLVTTFGNLAHAATANANFSVDVTLTTQCRVTGAAPTLAFAYTAFGSAVNATAVTVGFECTRNLAAPTVAFNGAGGAAGVVAGLQYALTVTPTTPGAGTAPTATVLGTAATYGYSIGGSMPAGQAGTSDGTNAATVTASDARMLIITY